MKFRRTFKVETVQNMGSDEMIARAARGFYGEAFPATVYAQDILALLEGGGEDK